MTLTENEKIERIKHEYERDLSEMPSAFTLNDVPAFYECITPEWLTAVVRKRYPDATVQSFQLDEIDSGTTNRRRIFLEYAENESSLDYPRSIFCKAAQDLKNRLTMSAGSALGETRFYNEVRERLKIEAPHSYFASVDTNSYRAIIVLEDLEQKVEFCNYKTPISLSRAESQMRLLAELHGQFYESKELSTSLSYMDSFPQRFNKLAKHHGLEQACNKGLIAAEAVMPQSIMHRIVEVWPHTLRAVASLDTLPQTITHGDVHLGNWYVIKGQDQMGLSDFQNVTRSHWSRDIAYTIATSLTIDNRRRWEKDLIKLYLEEVNKFAPVKDSFDAAWDLYRRQMTSVLAYWTVTLRPAPTMASDMQSESTTLCFLGRIGQAMEDLETLDSIV